jgi:2-polyprenyl-3-methyl-5-hydroxy-6-metoxy-1,4-benzoquinol methylase
MGLRIHKLKKPELKCCNKYIQSKKEIIYKKKPLGETDFGIKKYYRTYKTCKKCGHYFSNIKFNMDKLYDKKYSIKSYGNLNDLKKKFEIINNFLVSKSDNKQRVERVKKFIKKKNNLLDIGSGLGVFPFAMKKKTNVFLIEKDENFVLHLKKIFKKKLIGNDIFDPNLQKKYFQYFDFISINKVLEHIYDPDKFLNKALNYLKPGAIIYIEVPNAIALKINGKFSEEFFIEHLHVFSRVSFQNLIIRQKINLISLEEIKEPSGKFTLFAVAKKN